MRTTSKAVEARKREMLAKLTRAEVEAVIEQDEARRPRSVSTSADADYQEMMAAARAALAEMSEQ